MKPDLQVLMPLRLQQVPVEQQPMSPKKKSSETDKPFQSGHGKTTALNTSPNRRAAMTAKDYQGPLLSYCTSQ